MSDKEHNEDQSLDSEVVSFISSFCKELTHYIDNNLITTFTLDFEYKGKDYELSLSEKDKINPDKFDMNNN